MLSKLRIVSFIVVFSLDLWGYDVLKPIEEDIFKEYKTYSLTRNYHPLCTLNNVDYKKENVFLNAKLDQRERKLFEDTAYLQVFMVGTIGVLYMMPKSVTNWEDEDISLQEKWKQHIKNGPVWDEDDFAINYIGHPVSGAWYYMIAREDGFNPLESFAYSFVLSTFFWEYGYEAVAEIPSIQDLIFTPTLGAVMGEGFWYLQCSLDKNGGVILGSKILGNVAYFFLNPIKRITSSLDSYFDVSMRFRYEVFTSPALTQVSPMLKNIDYVPSHYGFILDIDF